MIDKKEEIVRFKKKRGKRKLEKKKGYSIN